LKSDDAMAENNEYSGLLVFAGTILLMISPFFC